MIAWNRYAAWALAAWALALGPSAGEALSQDAPSREGGAFAILIRNPNTDRGQPPFALVDDYGRVRRYVEPTPELRLERRVGERVRIRHDSGKTLLASQLEFTTGLRPLARSTERRPAEFRPPRKARSIERRDDWVVRTQHSEGAAPLAPPPGDSVLDKVTPLADDPAEPIVLEDLIAGDGEELPAPHSVRAETIYPLDEGHYVDAPPPPSPSEVCPECEAHAAAQAAPPAAPVAKCSDCDCVACRARRCKKHGGGILPNCSLGCGSWFDHGGCFADPSCCPPSRRGFYGRIDYLLWWFDSFDTPPLVTQGTVANGAALGPGTTVLFGGGDLLDNPRSGLRFTLGAWLDDRRDYAIELDYLFFETDSRFFSAGDPTGATVIGRPFFNLSPTETDGGPILPPAEDAQLVSFPDELAGTVDVAARSEFDTFGIRLRTGICCCSHGGCNACDGFSGAVSSPRSISRADFLIGYRYANLNESLVITENLTSLDPQLPGTFAIFDRFDTENEFHGVDLGFVSEWQTRRWSLELIGKIAVGVTEQEARINGATTISDGVNTVTAPGGLLALPSNIGSYERDQFSVLPELSARIGYRVTPRLSLSAGYSLLYWANVIRPGDQIDLNIDPRGIPIATATTVRPEFAFNETGFWAHGLNFGVDYNY